jgi:hypothetical protein
VSEPIRFYTDEQVARVVVEGLRRRGVHVLTCQEAKLLGESDEVHLAFATQHAHVIFTQDDDFLRLHAKGITHAGIVYAHQRTPIGVVIQGLLLIQQVLTPADMVNHVEFIS